MEKYYIVDSSILSDSVSRVAEAQKLLKSGAAKNISEAVKAVDISRGTFYKYKDLVFLNENTHKNDRHALISFMIEHKSGLLAEVLQIISESDANILTINQNIPINNMANVSVSMDIKNLNISMDNLILRIKELKQVSNFQLIGME
ncbi:ACT domain-containing protein [Companilactobacillus metriopterae]|uniref:ACT domain-containing protein n=1 Tax=Companilactobacillus metriopterae TaxID=1909267 RepID=UPI00100B1EEE|nr:ACT domain-containing protein [Companilactobacillus metriopterae]